LELIRIFVDCLKLQPAHVYEVHPRKDHRGVDLISDALPFGRLWYGEPNAIANAISNAKFRSRSHDAVIRLYHETGNVIETRGIPGQLLWRCLYVTRTSYLMCSATRFRRSAKVTTALPFRDGHKW